MTRRLAALLLTLAAAPAAAHRLDEYLQATILTVQPNRVEAQMLLTPGVAVLPLMLAASDANGDGTISPAEQRAYAELVLRDLSLRLDGHALLPRLRSWRFPPLDQMQSGSGAIEIHFDAELPPGGLRRQLTLDNRHLPEISAYLVNCLVPQDPHIRITAQVRNYTQSTYRLEYEQTGAPTSPAWRWQSLFWLLPAALLCAGLMFFRRRV